MSRAFRRYEILLPQRFNDGRTIPRRVLTSTIVELRSRFGAVSCESQRIRGHWQFQGDLYKDELIRLFVDVPDEPIHRDFFIEYKELLKARFEQIEIWLVSYPVDVL